MEEYNFDIVHDLNRNEDSDDDKSKSDLEGESSEDSTAESNPESEAETGDSEYYLDTIEHTEDMVDTSKIMPESNSDKDSDPDRSEVESTENVYVSGDDGKDKEDKLTRFCTYKEPDLDMPGIDVDTNAVAQFVEEFCEVGEEGDTDMENLSSRLIDVF